MRAACVTGLLVLALASGAEGRQIRGAGFSITIPDDWRVQTYDRGFVQASSADGSRFVLARPLLGRSADCGTHLQRGLGVGWAVFPGASTAQVSAVAGTRNVFLARFGFSGGRRAALMCVETSRRSGMFYGVAAPAARFDAEVSGLVGILRTFRYEAGGAPAPARGGQAVRGGQAAAAPVALPRMIAWRDPKEGAYTMQVPEGWRVTGGMTRIDVTHARSGVDMSTPDGTSTIRLGDPRLPQCTVPGPGMPQGDPGGMIVCPYRTGRQIGESYLRQTLSLEWGIEGLQVVSSEDRQDLSTAADQGPARFGLRVRNAFGQIHFRGTRRGQPVEGWLLANTQMLGSTPGQNFILGTYTQEIDVFAGPPARVALLSAISGHVLATVRWNIDWWQREQRIARELAERTLAMMRETAENQQKAFWARMDAMDQRREAVNDVLGGTVRLTDGQGNNYQAQAGSNYYFYDEEAGARTSNRNDAVVGTDVYPSPLVDLRPLEVVR